MKSMSYHRLLSGIDYDPLLGSWPDPSIDQRLLAESPPVARYILKSAHRHHLEGFSEPEQVWDDWLVLMDQCGSDDEGVQIALMGLIFLSHETRHHLDTYATPAGWSQLLAIAGEYSLLKALSESRKVGTRDTALKRVRRHISNHDNLFGNISSFRRAEYSNVPLTEKVLPDGRLRIRAKLADATRYVITVQGNDGIERGISLSSLLECRAILETAGNCAGKLRAAGASESSVRKAVRLLLHLGVDPERDDYWCLLSTCLPARNLEEAAIKVASGGPRKGRMMLATWFGLHVQHPGHVNLDLSWSPTIRTVFALKKLTAIPDAQWANPRADWEDACEQLGSMFGDLPLCESRQKWLQSFQNVEGSILSGDFGQGVASAHLTWLLKCAKAGIELRESEIKWIDKVGWPNQEEPLTIGPEADPPPDARTAWSRLRRLHRQIRMDISGESVVKLANSLFEP